MAHGHDSHGHGGHGNDSDEIVLHQEKLLPTMLIAGVFAVITLFGLAQAGNTKLDLTLGKAAYEKNKAEMPIIQKHSENTNTHDASAKEEHGNTEVKHEEAPANGEHTEAPPAEEHHH